MTDVTCVYNKCICCSGLDEIDPIALLLADNPTINVREGVSFIRGFLFDFISSVFSKNIFYKFGILKFISGKGRSVSIEWRGSFELNI